jgi:hypothetical protein
MHARSRIKQDIRDLLVGALTAAGERVFVSRINPVFLKDLPAIQVYAKDETVAGDQPGARSRVLIVTIGAAAGGADCDRQADDLALAIETAMDQSNNLRESVSDIAFTGTVIEYSGDGERNIAEANLSFQILYLG